MKIVKKYQVKIVIFTAVKNRCILHGHVFVIIGCSVRMMNILPVSESSHVTQEVKTGFSSNNLSVIKIVFANVIEKQ